MLACTSVTIKQNATIKIGYKRTKNFKKDIMFIDQIQSTISKTVQALNSWVALMRLQKFHQEFEDLDFGSPVLPNLDELDNFCRTAAWTLSGGEIFAYFSWSNKQCKEDIEDCADVGKTVAVGEQKLNFIMCTFILYTFHELAQVSKQCLHELSPIIRSTTTVGGAGLSLLPPTKECEAIYSVENIPRITSSVM